MIDPPAIRQNVREGTFRTESAIALLEVFARSSFRLLLQVMTKDTIPAAIQVNYLLAKSESALHIRCTLT